MKRRIEELMRLLVNRKVITQQEYSLLLAIKD